MSSSPPDRDAFTARVVRSAAKSTGKRVSRSWPWHWESQPGPGRIWRRGVTISGPVLLKFLALTGVSPDWLLEGEGEPYAGRSADRNAQS